MLGIQKPAGESNECASSPTATSSRSTATTSSPGKPRLSPAEATSACNRKRRNGVPQHPPAGNQVTLAVPPTCAFGLPFTGVSPNWNRELPVNNVTSSSGSMRRLHSGIPGVRPAASSWPPIGRPIALTPAQRLIRPSSFPRNSRWRGRISLCIRRSPPGHAMTGCCSTGPTTWQSPEARFYFGQLRRLPP